MKTIVIDCRFAHLPTGIGRYTREIVPGLVQHVSSAPIALIVSEEGIAWAKGLPGELQLLTARSSHYSFAEQREIPSLLRKCNASLFFCPHFNVPFFCRVPFVATIHDLILHRYPNQASAGKHLAYRILMSRTVRNAKRLIAVSNFTASELRSTYGKGCAARIRVIREGVSPVFHVRSQSEQDAVLSRLGISRPFFLYVGNAKEHKNLPLLLEAFRRIADLKCTLVLVTGGKEAGMLEIPSGVKIVPFTDDDTLASLYSGATAFVSPSLYEGFGLPLAEAAACGCPVIAVNATATVEVAPQDSVLLPPDPDAFVAAMKTVQHVRTVPSSFSWDEAALKTAEVLCEVLP